MISGPAGLIAIGLIVGAIGTLIGSGGGFLLVPTLLLLDTHIPPQVAAGISLAVVFFNATSGSIAYSRMGRVDFRAGTVFAIAAMPGAILGAYTTAYIPRRAFDAIFGFLLIAAATYLFSTSGEKKDSLESGKYNLWLGVAISAGVGFLSSLLGIGGGIIHVPALTQALNFSVHTATATSHFVLSITALVATLVRLKTGSLNGQLPTIAWLSVGAIAGAQGGAKLSSKVRGSWILRGLAIGLGLIGVRILLPLF
ncbi:MAG TPA: sulfite exporter TauE/SafE family protein [Terriglobia bacterium]|nr:sulfite exporter TauE/SafE family protein [Terriglobia bacterium]